MSGEIMAKEVGEAVATFVRAASTDHTDKASLLEGRSAIYTIARGSSDAASTILSYELMRELKLPVTSLPPSIFSLGAGVDLKGALALAVSQSGGSEDLVRSVRGAKAAGANAIGILNVVDSPVGREVDAVAPISAGPEIAVPATKSVVGTVGAGLALLAGFKPEYAPKAKAAAEAFAALGTAVTPKATELFEALKDAAHIFVVGRGAGFGCAQEVALKLKETSVLHAESYSASEVLHGPLQLVKRGLTVVILDTEEPSAKSSLDLAEARFTAAGGKVVRLSSKDITDAELVPAAAAALLLCAIYPVIRDVALALGYNPDSPETLSKVTQTI